MRQWLKLPLESTLPRPSPRATGPRDGQIFRHTRQLAKAALIEAILKLKPEVLIDLEKCFPLPDNGRRPRVSDPANWPGYDAWARRWGLRIFPPGDDWLRVWAWGHQLAPHRADSRWLRSSLRGRPRVPRDRWSAMRAAESFVRRKFMEQSWREIVAALAITKNAVDISTARADVDTMSRLLSISTRRGTRQKARRVVAKRGQ